MGPRSGNRDQQRDNFYRPEESAQEVDTWDNTIASSGADQAKDGGKIFKVVNEWKLAHVNTFLNRIPATFDTWGDWDNNEYTGSLADTKVFTPSAAQSVAANGDPSSGAPTELTAPPGLEQTVPNPPAADDIVQQYSATVVSSTATAGAVAAVNSGLLNAGPQIAAAVQQQQQQQQQNNQVQYPEINAAAVTNAAATTSVVPSHLRQTTVDLPQQLSAASLSAEQSQYFNSLSSQNSTQQQQQQAQAAAQQAAAAAAAAAQQQAAALKAYQVPVSVQYSVPGGYVTAGSTYGEVAAQQAPQTRKPRARVPPPSKIPSTAVEMPGDSLNTIGYLDVQFGGLDFGTDDSFDSLDKFNTSSLDNSGQNVTSPVDVSGGGDYNQSSGSIGKQQQQQQPSPLGQPQQNANLVASALQQASQMHPTANDSLSGQNDSLYAATNNQRSVSNVGVQQQQQHVPNSVSLNNSGESFNVDVGILFGPANIFFLYDEQSGINLNRIHPESMQSKCVKLIIVNRVNILTLRRLLKQFVTL